MNERTSTGTGPDVPTTRELARPSLLRLVVVELRKIVDTRAGRWVLASTFGLVVLALAVEVSRSVSAAGDSTVSFAQYLDTVLLVLQSILPALGVLAMTTEWTQRTALTTFTLVPRRGRVLRGKLGALLTLAIVAAVLGNVLTAVATFAAEQLGGGPAQWGDVVGRSAGLVLALVLLMLLGAALGALVQQTAAALVLFFVAPVLLTAGAASVLGDGVRWVAVLTATGNVADLDLSGALWPTLSALTLWILVPLVAGVLRTLRREVS